MTAAVARPPLFSHLVASKPEHERGSRLATLSSVALHGAIVTAAVLVTARVTPPVETITPAEIVPLENYQAAPVEARTAPGPLASGPVAPAPPVIDFHPPEIVPTEIPPAGRIEDMRKLLEQLEAGRTGAGTSARAAVGTGAGTAGPEVFVPITVAPELLNRPEVARAMLRLYPQMLMQAGIGGTVLVWLHLDENGAVIETRVKQGSGHNTLDEAALKVAQIARFSPAYNRDLRVRVWVELPVVFGAR
jgi:protein TonB